MDWLDDFFTEKRSDWIVTLRILELEDEVVELIFRPERDFWEWNLLFWSTPHLRSDRKSRELMKKLVWIWAGGDGSYNDNWLKKTLRMCITLVNRVGNCVHHDPRGPRSDDEQIQLINDIFMCLNDLDFLDC